jgi:hypothetical protein
MTQFTSPLPESPSHPDPVQALEISPKYSIVRALGYLAAWAGVLSVCALPYGYLSMSHGTWNTNSDRIDFSPLLLGAYLTVLLGVSALGIAAGIASGAGKPWSRGGMMLYADLTIVMAIVGVLPVYMFIVHQPVLDIGLRHAMEMLVILKLWVVELPLSIVILYSFTRPGVASAYEHPEMEAPDRSRR